MGLTREDDICLVKFIRDKSRDMCIRHILKDADYTNEFE